MHSGENQQSFEGFMDVQSFFLDTTVDHEEDAQRKWAESHGSNFREFFDSASPELQAQLISAAERHDASQIALLADAFEQFESKQTEETLH